MCKFFSEEWKTMSEKLVEANSTKCEAQVRETRGCLIPNA